MLLSAYNGTEYIKEQIDSIYRQSFQDFQLYVRDDGSTQEFKKLLQKLQQQYGFVLTCGENVGFVKSFLKLLQEVEDTTYYAFADQDDIWLPEKLQYAVEWLEQEGDKAVPVLYHSAYDIINTDRRVIDRFYFPNEGYDFRRSITENHYSGFAMVINRTMRDMILKGDPDKIGYHDWWAAMISEAFGIGYSDERVTALHRAHGDNVTTFNLGTRLEWLKESLTGEQELHKRAIEFDYCFGDLLTQEKQKVLDLFSKEHYSLPTAIRKCFYPKRWRPMLSSELVMRFLMLIGRI